VSEAYAPAGNVTEPVPAGKDVACVALTGADGALGKSRNESIPRALVTPRSDVHGKYPEAVTVTVVRPVAVVAWNPPKLSLVTAGVPEKVTLAPTTGTPLMASMTVPPNEDCAGADVTAKVSGEPGELPFPAVCPFLLHENASSARPPETTAKAALGRDAMAFVTD
jgi:hypothetical protein